MCRWATGCAGEWAGSGRADLKGWLRFGQQRGMGEGRVEKVCSVDEDRMVGSDWWQRGSFTSGQQIGGGLLLLLLKRSCRSLRRGNGTASQRQGIGLFHDGCFLSMMPVKRAVAFEGSVGVAQRQQAGKTAANSPLAQISVSCGSCTQRHSNVWSIHTQGVSDVGAVYFCCPPPASWVRPPCRLAEPAPPASWARPPCRLAEPAPPC
eukprot:352841-Chlamydomonas_euryale.AAC.4